MVCESVIGFIHELQNQDEKNPAIPFVGCVLFFVLQTIYRNQCVVIQFGDRWRNCFA